MRPVLLDTGGRLVLTAQFVGAEPLTASVGGVDCPPIAPALVLLAVNGSTVSCRAPARPQGAFPALITVGSSELTNALDITYNNLTLVSL